MSQLVYLHLFVAITDYDGEFGERKGNQTERNDAHDGPQDTRVFPLNLPVELRRLLMYRRISADRRFDLGIRVLASQQLFVVFRPPLHLGSYPYCDGVVIVHLYHII